MTRKIDTERVYKVVKFLVLFISIISIIYSSYLIITYKKREQKTIMFTEMCNIENKGLNYPDSCSSFWESSRDIDNYMIKSFLLGIILPIVFFGGKALVNYVAPKKLENKK